MSILVLTSMLLVASGVRAQTISGTRLLDHHGYFTRILQETVWRLEESDWSSFRVPAVHEARTVTFYDWIVEYAADYENGFLISFTSVDIRQNSVTQTFTPTTAAVTGLLQFHDVVTGYDVVVTTPDGEQRYTAVYTHHRVDYTLTIRKELTTGDIATECNWINQQGINGYHIEFLPSNNLTEVMSRSFAPASPSLTGWATNIRDALEHVKHRVEFPRLCYNCA